jgi:diguanylate cyclase (GGDEF)-like protein
VGDVALPQPARMIRISIRFFICAASLPEGAPGREPRGGARTVVPFPAVAGGREHDGDGEGAGGARGSSAELRSTSESPSVRPLDLLESGQLEGDTAGLQNPRGQPLERRPFLVVLAGVREGELFPLEPNVSLVVGRGDRSDIRILDDSISRRHCSVTLRDEGLQVEDLGSHNGTFVGDARITRELLAPEDIVRLGVTSLLKYALISRVEERYRQRMVRAALLDPLTMVFNRRHFEDRFVSECAAAHRHGRPLALLLIDIDDFKAVNDRLGHPTGDVVLRKVAQALQGAVRSEDALFRYGGEEFTILARETSLEGGVNLAERLRRCVAALRVPTGDGQGEGLRVTVSVGVASFRPGGQNDLVGRADAALYQAKHQGKDRVVGDQST